MIAFESLLVPVDFGDASASALCVAGRLARLSHGTIRALHAEPLEAPAYFTHEQLAALVAQRRHLREAADAHLVALVTRYTRAPFTTAISPDTPDDVSESTLAVVSVPLPHDRAWQAAIGERLVRDSCGVMFVPERAAVPRSEVSIRRT